MCRYVIVGKRGSGKKECLDEFVKYGLRPLVKYTTRKKKKDEAHGKEWMFVKKTSFDKMCDDRQFISVSKIKTNYYGLKPDMMENCDVAILSKEELFIVRTWFPELIRYSSIIFLDIPDSVRKKKLKHRYSGDNVDETIKHIINEDNRDFKDFNYFDIVFNNIDEAKKCINRLTHRNEEGSSDGE